MDRRKFLIGLFGTAAVAAAGPLPKAMLEVSDTEFLNRANYFASLKSQAVGDIEIYCDGKDYSFTPLPGFRPMREESNRLAAQAIQQLWESFSDAPPK